MSPPVHLRKFVLEKPGYSNPTVPSSHRVHYLVFTPCLMLPACKVTDSWRLQSASFRLFGCAWVGGIRSPRQGRFIQAPHARFRASAHPHFVMRLPGPIPLTYQAGNQLDPELSRTSSATVCGCRLQQLGVLLIALPSVHETRSAVFLLCSIATPPETGSYATEGGHVC